MLQLILFLIIFCDVFNGLNSVTLIPSQLIAGEPFEISGLPLNESFAFLIDNIPTPISECSNTTESPINGIIKIDCECSKKLTVSQNVVFLNEINYEKIANITFTPVNYSISINSTGNLFSPVTIHVMRPTTTCTTTSPPPKIFLDYRTFEFFPKRQNHWERITNITLTNDKVIFGCHYFLNRGVYRFQIGNTVKELSLNSSEIQPTVQFREDSIFPHCNGDFPLTWKLPDCPLPSTSTTQFRIRVLAILDGPEGIPEDWSYVEEFPALPPNSSALSSMATIPCSQFDIIYKKFCFELVSVDDRSHRVSEWDRRCVFTEPLNMFGERWKMPLVLTTHCDHRSLEDEEERQQQNPRRVYRKHSDPVKLKADYGDFVRHWNGESTPPRVNPICVLRARSSAATDFEEVRHVNWAFSPRRTRLNHSLIDPELCKLRQKYERRVQRRRSLSVANHSLYAEKANPKKSAVIEKYYRALPFGRRCLSIGTLLILSEHEIDVDLFGVKQSKRVSFSAPTAKRKSVCPETNKPAPILLKEPKTIDSDYPLSHMDYATFKAWRNGETFRASVDSSTDTEPEKKTPQESMGKKKNS